MKRAAKFMIFTVILFVFVCCSKNNQDPYQYSIPLLADDGWEVGDADEAGLKTEVLKEMMDYIRQRKGDNIHSILLFKDGKLVFEEYFEGYLYSSNPPGSNGDYIQYDRETDHFLASVSKTVTSVIFGIAVKEGFMFINGGYWKDKQLVTDDWIDDSTDEHILTNGRTLPMAHAYGYQWWIMDFHASASAFGRRSQLTANEDGMLLCSKAIRFR
jgi:CubicO group peptidase (beta-lactamase class C family)